LTVAPALVTAGVALPLDSEGSMAFSLAMTPSV